MGGPSVNYFLDAEFHEDGSTIDLISIALVAADGRAYYAVNEDAQLHRVSRWVRRNILPQLPRYGNAAWRPYHLLYSDIEAFVLEESPTFWAYYAAYDWVAFCQLFGTMMDLPKRFPKFCMDLKQLAVMKGNPKLPTQECGEHNALADARWNRDVYDFLTRLP